MIELKKGMKMIRMVKQVGKPPIAFITADPDSHLIGMGYKPGGPTEFRVNSVNIGKIWEPAKNRKRKKINIEELTGKQLSFLTEKISVRQIWRKHIKT